MGNVDDDSSASGLLASNDSRNKTLELLQNYIQRQRTLLQRTQADVEKLKTLKQCAADDPHGTLSSILGGNINNNNVRHNDGAKTEPNDTVRASVWKFGNLSQLVDDMHGDNETAILKSIDWGLFEGHDSTYFLDMQRTSHNLYASTVFPPASCMPPPPPPSSTKTDCSPSASIYPRPRDSYLRAFVREKRAALVEPVLAKAAEFLASLGPDSETECDETQLIRGKYNKSKAHGSKADAARRRKQEEAAMIRPRGPGGIFVKRDKASANGVTPSAASRSKQRRSVSRSLDGADETILYSTPAQRRRRTSSVHSVATPIDIDEGPLATCKPKRTRRPSARFVDTNGSISRSNSGKSLDLTPPDEPPTPPRPKLTIRLPPMSSFNFRKPELSPATSPSSTTSLRLRTASASTSTSTSRQSFSPPAFPFPSKHEDVDDEMEDHHYSTGEEEEEESHIGYDGDAMSISTVTSISRSRSRTRSETPNGMGYTYPSPYCEYAGKYTATSSTSASPDASTSGRKRGKGKTNGKERERAKPKPKPKSETFNIPWSVSEQHLLEKLLEEYPDGVRNRWQKISEAMGNRRTPRQVASRVQKFFLKLKKYGLS